MRRAVVAILSFLVFSGGASGVHAQTGDDSSRDNPLPIGQTFDVGDYEITVLSVNPDAESLVLAENQFNDPAQDGDVMVLITVEVTYTGNETGNPGWELMFKVVGNNNRGYTQSDKDCGVIPNPEFSAGELFPEGTAEYNLCWMVSEVEAPTLVMYVEPTFSFSDDQTVWISLDPNQSPATPAA